VAALGAEPAVGDVTDPEAWRHAARGVRAVVHAAALVSQRQPFERYFAVNVEGTRLAIDAARAAGARLVHLPSVAVYGRDVAPAAPGGPVTEDFPFRPIAGRDYYARTKRLAEDAVREAAARGLDALSLRPNVIYGERDRLFTPKLLRLVRLGVVPRVGDGRNRLSCVYAGNVAAAVVAALDAPRRPYAAHHVTEDAAPALDQVGFVAAFAAAAGVRAHSVPVPAVLARAAAQGWTLAQWLLAPRGYRGLGRSAISFLTGHNPYDAGRARTALGWTPPWATPDAIARTVARGT
jgi:nucleoside-diphosphate-sugar epimerase